MKMQHHYHPIRSILHMSKIIIKSIIFVIVLCSTPQASDFSLNNSIKQLQDILLKNPRKTEEISESLINQWLDIRSFNEAIFGSYVRESLESYKNVLTPEKFNRLVKQYQTELDKSFRKKLVTDLNTLLSTTDLKRLSITSMGINGSMKTVTLDIQSDSFPNNVELLMDPKSEKLSIIDVKVDENHLSEYYQKRFRNIIKNLYSLPVLTAHFSDSDYIKLEDFSVTPVGELPLDWGSWRKKDQGKPMPYQIEGDSTRYLAARDSGYSVILGKFLHWNPLEYPLLTWCWRATHLPPGGNEFIDNANDSAVGLYVIFSQNWLRVPKQLKYVWSSTLPLDTIGRRKKMFRPWFFVKESGDKNLNYWQFEVVDLENDHKLKLGGKPANRTIGLGILSDANSTKSYAEGYYADFRAWKRPNEGLKTISDHCGSLRKQLKQPDD